MAVTVMPAARVVAVESMRMRVRVLQGVAIELSGIEAADRQKVSSGTFASDASTSR
jgi:hypothetical protein